MAAALREMRRVDEEMRKRERLEAERKEREAQISEQEADDERKAIEECERSVNAFLKNKILYQFDVQRNKYKNIYIQHSFINEIKF